MKKNLNKELTSLHRGIDRWFEDFFEPFAELNAPSSTFYPPVDIEETADLMRLHFDLPGVDEKDVKIEWNNGQLAVSGERKFEKTEESASRKILERSFGSFYRSFSLPSGVDPQKIKADFKSGVLTIDVPKAEASQPKQIPIEPEGATPEKRSA